MRNKYIKTLLLTLLLCSFQKESFSQNYNSKLEKSLNYILSTIVGSELKKIDKKTNKNKLILYVNVRNEKGLFRESDLIFDFQLWSKQNFDIRTKHKFDGIEIYFGNTKRKYRKMFNVTNNLNTQIEITKTESKPPLNQEKQNKENQNIVLTEKKSIKDPLSWINVYFNSKIIITYIDREEYIPLLKKQIEFDKNYY